MTSGDNQGVTAVEWQTAWLAFRTPRTPSVWQAWQKLSGRITVVGSSEQARSAEEVLRAGLSCCMSSDSAGAGASDYPFSGVRLEERENSHDTDSVNVSAEDDLKTLVISVSSRRLFPYAAYWLLRFMQRDELPPEPGVVESTTVCLRAISQWDNLDRTIERGYGGLSFFDWDDCSRFGERQDHYARLLCAAGINTVFLNNVNASPRVLGEACMESLAVFANRFRRFGIRVGIAVNFGSPAALGELETADPLDPDVRAWWAERARHLYQRVPDLVGLLVKANSEGQPGPQDYGRDHTDGANMLADAVAPYGGAVFWRAFVYRWDPHGRVKSDGHDSLHDAYDTFVPLDGKFADNVTVVVKNGPIDFQIREPVHPLFAALPQTRRLLEFQVTQEYTGQDTHLCFLPSQWAHYLGEPISETGRLSDLVTNQAALLGVSAWGDSECWSGHPLAQANLYGLGRLAWNPSESPETIARDWTAQTFGTDSRLMKTIPRILLMSWRAYESYTSPLGLGMMHCKARHFDPAPQEREYAHRATPDGVGRDRTAATGSGFTNLFPEPLRSRYEHPDLDCESLVLMFHRLSWDHVLPSGLSVRETMEASYHSGVATVAEMRRLWGDLVDVLEPAVHREIATRFDQQHKHALFWAQTMVTYFESRRK